MAVERDELKQAMQKLIDALAVIYDAMATPLFERMPLDQAAPIVAGIEAQTMGLRFTIDHGPKEELSLKCSVIKEDRIFTLFELNDLSNLAREKLFLVKKNARGETEERD